jgi:hypothetical protein
MTSTMRRGTRIETTGAGRTAHWVGRYVGTVERVHVASVIVADQMHPDVRTVSGVCIQPTPATATMPALVPVAMLALPAATTASTEALTVTPQPEATVAPPEVPTATAAPTETETLVPTDVPQPPVQIPEVA